jgi:peptidoglycan/xylan/chitin deacetylase (PgdA/CDA1 family)
MNNYSYENYVTLMDYAKSVSDVTSFANNNGKNGVILRHDVDIHPEFAYKLYDLEKDNNINSTFFFMVSSHLYNVFSKRNSEIIREIHDNGFEIGLHFSTHAYGEYDTNYDYAKESYREAKILSSIIGEQVTRLCLHCPIEEKIIPWFNNVEWTENFVGDSKKDIDEQDIYKMISKSDKEVVSLLFHPIFWSDCKKCDVKEEYMKYLYDGVGDDVQLDF